jgi:putative nucleotidyltransferase with HDIG domain
MKNNLTEELIKIRGIMKLSEEVSAKKLIYSLPNEIKSRFFGLWNVPQNVVYHPEGNTLKHVITVVKRAIAKYPNNMNIIIAALFHDIGKDETLGYNEKTGQPTAYGHENVSAELVKQYSDWIQSVGADPEVVYFIVSNHMRAHNLDKMRQFKQDQLKSHPNFNDLMSFETLDKSGVDI